MRTIDELETALSDSLAWRRHELHALLAEARGVTGASRTGVMRAGVALLYAHWEGFVKEAANAYLKFVARRRSKFSELKPCFVAIAVEWEMNRAQDLSGIRRRNAMAERYCNFAEGERASIPVRDVDTRSNLNSDVLSDIFEMLGLDVSVLSTKFHLIDYSLLKTRNEIAHGRWVPVELESYGELHHEVLSMIETVRRMIVSAAENKTYLRGPSAAAS
jgi:hypothetical protein